MPDKTSLYSFHKTAGLLPDVLLLLLLQVGAEEAAPWYFLPTFGHDICGMQGGVELALPMASRGCNLVDDIMNDEMVEKKAKMYKKCQAGVQKMHSGLIFHDAVEPENNMAW